MTEWKTIPGYEGTYEVSDEGQVRSVERWRRVGKGEGSLRLYPSQARSLYIDKAGYPRVTLKTSGVARSHLVHHLVLEAFVGPKPVGQECRHLNGNPADNRLENLQWGTSSENSYDVVRHGNHHGAKKTHCKNGHEFTPENTMQQTGGKGRACRTCNRERARAFYEAHKGPRQMNNRDKTHCKRGHEFTEENTIWRKDGGRQCRACTKAYFKARYEARKQM
jgi:hypothetical protein